MHLLPDADSHACCLGQAKAEKTADLQARLDEASLMAVWKLEGSAWRASVLMGPALLKDVIKVLMLV